MNSRLIGLALGAIVIVGLILRIHFLVRGGIIIDSDEAIVGLMAKHLLEGEGLPIFYYGQHYMGSLESLLVAGSFSIFGYSAFALKLVPLLFSLVFICLNHELAKRFVGPKAALLAALLTAVPPSPLLIWSVMARGGFIELLVIGSAALIVAVDLLREECRSAWRFALLGLLLGLGWWVNNQIVFYIAPIGLVIGVSAIFRLGLLRALMLGAVTLFSFMIGGLPFWIYNLVGTPMLRSFGLFSPADPEKILGHFAGFFGQALPMILGAKRFWADTDLFSHASLTVYGLSGLMVLHLLIALVRCPGSAKDRPNLAQLTLLLMFLIFVPLIFCLSSFGWLSMAPRYLLPLYSVLFVVIALFPGALFCQAGDSLRQGTFISALRVVAVGSFLVINIVSNYGFGGAVPGQPFVFMGDRVPLDNKPLYRWLNQHHYRFIRANYWVGYRVALETKERVIFSHFRGQGLARIPGYERSFPSNEEEVAYVLSPKEGEIIARAFTLLGYSFRKSKVGGYSVIDLVERQPWDKNNPANKLVPVSGSSTTDRPELALMMLDGEVGSRWGSGRPQNPSMGISFWFEPGVRVTGVDIDYGFWTTDFPRELVVEGQRVDGTRCILLDTRGEPALNYYLEGERKVLLRFSAEEFVAINLRQTGSDAMFDWSVAEMTFWGVGDGNWQGEPGR